MDWVCFRIFGILVASLVGLVAQAQNLGMNPFTRAQCEAFKSQLGRDARVTVGNLVVPRSYSQPEGDKINMMYWVRRELDPARGFPPLLLIHGGVGGTSLGMFTWKKIMDEYPGPVVSADLRGEGCSNFFHYAQNFQNFGAVTIAATIEDLERLRLRLFPQSQWRVFGQSRGSFIVHRYLEQHPSSLESAHAHGFSMQSRKGFENYSFTRSQFNVRTGRVFYSRFPGAARVIEEIRTELAKNPVCFVVNYAADELPVSDRPQVCGTKAIDAFSGRLSAMSGWQGFADSLLALRAPEGLDWEGAVKLLQTTLDSGLYMRYPGYIFGTNALEFHGPDITVLEKIRDDAEMRTAPLSEGRFTLETAFPIYAHLFGPHLKASHRPYDFKAVRQSLSRRRSLGYPLVFNVFYSEWDPVAAPEAFDYERRQLRGYARFHFIPQSAHDGWKTHPQVADALLSIPVAAYRDGENRSRLRQ